MVTTGFPRLVCTLLAAAFSSACLSSAEPEGDKAPVPVGKEIETILTKAMAAKQIPGGVVWLEHEGKSEVVVLGQRNVVPPGEPLTRDTIFDLASLTKVMATTPAILLLWQEKKLDLNDPVRLHLPEFKGEDRAGITIRQMMTHVSGLPGGVPLPPDCNGYDAVIARACSVDLQNPPGTTFRYSDVNFILLGEIVRRTSGQSLDAFVKSRFYGPLGMTRTAFNPPPEWWPLVAPTATNADGTLLRGVVHDPTARRMGGVAGHAGLFSNIDDMARFSRMMLGDGQVGDKRFFEPHTMRLMTEVNSPPTVWSRRGLGWDIDSGYSRPRGIIPGVKDVLPKLPLGSFGHTGFTGTSMWLDPTSKTSVVFLSSRLHGVDDGDVRDVYSFLGQLAARQALPLTKATPAAITPRGSEEVPTVLTGIDVLARRNFAPLAGKRVGLVTNHTGHDKTRRSTIDVLYGAGNVKLVALFSPEHGIRGELDQSHIPDGKDSKTKLPIYSLYGKSRVPLAEQLKGLDALVFDMQDIGCRFYTYIATMKGCLEAAAAAGVAFVVLDRPNPLGGTMMEGPVDSDELVFTACYPLPLRHGMTIGELARMFHADLKEKSELIIVPCEGLTRDLWFDETGLPWTNPSPNMRSLTAATVYPGVGLLEFSVSVGRGTDRPFSYVGAPYVDELEFAHAMNTLGLPGVRFVPVRFTPTASVFANEPCQGIEIIVTDREILRPVEMGISLAATLQRLYPKSFALDKMQVLLQRKSALEALRNGMKAKDITAAWQEAILAFAKRREPFLLYR
jgi:uncharacterized protein YbbC (DUF1343 family)/CubicO group peptidase (beta-lactamase class C family)